MTPSIASTTLSDAASVGTVEPGMRERAISSLASSPPRAGVKAFSATPAA